MKKALLLLAMASLLGMAAAAQTQSGNDADPSVGAVAAPVPTKACSLCTLPSGLYCWADYEDPSCTPPSAGPSGATIVGHCTPSQASQFCPGHPSNPAPGASPWCAVCLLPSGYFCAANYGSPCTNPVGSGVVGPCSVWQANTFCAGHYYTPAPAPPSTPTPPPSGPGATDAPTDSGTEASIPPAPTVP